MTKQGTVVSTIKVSVLFVLVFLSGVLSAADTTIIGEVDDQFQIFTTDGEVYVIADTNAGTEVATEHINETVEIVGTVGYSEEDDANIITVKDYKVVTPDLTDEQ